MAFKKGEPRPANAGRKKGSKNKLTSFREAIEATGFDVAQEMVDLYRGKKTPPSIKLSIIDLILAYSIPKPKPLEGFENPLEDIPDMTDEEAIAAVTRNE